MCSLIGCVMILIDLSVALPNVLRLFLLLLIIVSLYSYRFLGLTLNLSGYVNLVFILLTSKRKEQF